MSTQQEGQAGVKPDLFLPRHPGDVVRLVTALAARPEDVRTIS
jgi:hypothetical protein